MALSPGYPGIDDSQAGMAMHPRVEKPRLIFWELTTGCNLRCLHCRASAQELSSPFDLPTAKARELVEQISTYARPILILSGGEPLYRRDLFEIARFAADRGLIVALASNGTMITPDIAARIREAGIRRVAISFDGAEAATHDAFRGVPGSFEAARRGLRAVQEVGLSTQINTTIARHNAHQLPQILELALAWGVNALHTFLLVPVGCGVNIADEQMVPAAEYEKILHWFYDREREGKLELKATCAPHYFRVRKQRQVAERRAAQVAGQSLDVQHPGSIAAELKPSAAHMHQHGTRHPQMSAVTKGCLAGSGVCFISHQGEVFPCGYLPVKAGDLRTQTFAEVWESSPVFRLLRDTDNLKGKCGLCEFRNLCLGCRARAYAATADFLAEEPFCVYQPRGGRCRPTAFAQSMTNSLKEFT